MLLTDHLLLNYKRCNRRTYLEIYGNSQQQDPEKDFLLKLKRENQTHIHNILRSRSFNYQQPEVSRHNWQLNSKQTVALMEQGVDCIVRGMLSLTFAQWQSIVNYNACLDVCLTESKDDSAILLNEIIFVAAPTILIKQPGHSKFGDWEYMPVNIKLGRRPKPEYKLIAAFHAQILAVIQEVVPVKSQLILREQQDYYINLEQWLPRMQQSVADCFEMLTSKLEPEVFISRQRCNLCHWYNYCYGIAQSAQHLSLIPGITPKRYEYLKQIGVDNLESLGDVPESDLSEIMEEDVARHLKQQVDSLKSNSAIVRSSFNLINQQPIPTGAIELYFDIEAEPERQIDYLLGVLLVDRGANTEQFSAFLAKNLEEEGKIWQEFLDFTALYPDAPIFHYSEYEVDTIKRLGKLYGTPQKVTKELLSRFVDLHEWVIESVVLPVESYSLKSLANWLGFYWRETEGSGDQSVCWYDQWLMTNNTSLLNLILSYNEDDCRATRYLKDWLLDFLESQRNLRISSIRQDRQHLSS
jgi:predicted RecB family nuclease